MRPPMFFTILITVLLVGCFQTFAGEKVIRCPNPIASLHDRWTWAEHEATSRGFSNEYWIGYSIEKLMEKNSFVGSFDTDERRNHPTLAEVIADTTLNETGKSQRYGHDIIVSDGVVSLDEKKSEEKIKKEIGILFHYKSEGAEEITVSNLSLHVRLKNDPLLWLEGVKEDESITFLQTFFGDARSSDIKEKLVTAIGIHSSNVAYPFLKKIAAGSESDNVRENAVFWISQVTTSGEAVQFLSGIAQSDRSEDVQEKAIFSLSEMNTAAATEALISIARTDKNNELRKKATFWLGEKASEKAVSTLKELVEDEDTEIQKSALFALTQLPDNHGVDELIRIAKTHQNPAVRKEAIFWLGQSDDQRALDALTEIAR